jgi:hypothetical protein
MAKRSFALLILCLGALFVLPAIAAADTGDVVEPQHEPATAGDGFQSGVCIENQIEETPGVTDTSKPFCSAETPSLFFTQAGGHPPFAFDQYIVQHETVAPGVVEPLIEPYVNRVLKTERVDLPVGFTENPQSSPKCSKEDFEAIGEIPGSGGQFGHVPACDPETIVGRNETWLVVNTANAVPAPSPPAPEGTFLPRGYVIPPQAAKGSRVALYNLEPEFGEPARLGFYIGFSKKIILEGGVAWENDFHEYFTIHLPEPSVPFSSLRSRLVAFGRSGDGTHVTLPSTCYDPNELPDPYSTWFRGESYGEPNPTFPEGSTPWQAKLPDGARTTGCDAVPFDPSLEVDAGTNDVDSPAAATVTTRVPFDPAIEGGEGISQSHVRKAEVSLPQGMGLNPSGAQGLVACNDAQFKKGVREMDNNCPDGSNIGTVEVESAPLAEPLVGNVYVGVQNPGGPESGERFRILLEAKSEAEGINARLVGHVKADSTTGALTAVIDDELTGEFAGQLPSGLPQVPFEEIRVHINGSKEVLSSPPICSAGATSHFEPWARPGERKPVNSSVTLSTDPTGGDCPQTMAERKFAPTYVATVDNRQAGAYSPYTVRLARRDGEQELKVADVTLPKGLTGKLAGIPYCPDDNIIGAIGKSGYEERANPSCSGASYLGKVITRSGTGDHPLELEGVAYLAGPYRGAALSLVTMTPAMAGPFDLGNVVVRVALGVDPETAQIHAYSDLIPDVFGGVKLDLRNIDLRIDRDKFMINPTNCYYQETTGTINGGGADPTNPATFSSYPVYDPWQTVGCGSLGFKPNLKVQLYGPTKRAKNPRLKATLTARKGDANIGRTALRLPKALFLEQSHIGTVCTRPQLASHTCPKASIYGKAWAQSPLLSGALKGDVYLVSSDNELPDLLVDLRGQVEIYLRGVISGKGGGLKTVFQEVPDVPVSKFVLNMQGGKKSLLVNSENICKKKQRAFLNMRGWNNKKVKTKKFKLNIVSCGKKKG